MQLSSKIVVPLAATALWLSGCAAAVIPVVVSGIAARQGLKHRHGKLSVSSSAEALPVKVPDVAPPPAAPRDPAAMSVGTIYAGGLPSGQTVATKIADPAPTETAEVTVGGKTSVPRSDWSDVLHYVARRYAGTDTSSALLTRGSSLMDPHPLACAGLSRAVLVDLEAVTGADGKVRASAAAALGAIETIGVTVVYGTARSGSPLATATAALTKAGLQPARPGLTLIVARAGREATVRATAGAFYCVIALASDRPEAFPNRAPDSYDVRTWQPGWFYLGTQR